MFAGPTDVDTGRKPTFHSEWSVEISKAQDRNCSGFLPPFFRNQSVWSDALYELSSRVSETPGERLEGPVFPFFTATRQDFLPHIRGRYPTTPCAPRNAFRCHNQGMLRDKNLVPLSRQHQHALALCVRINRALLATPKELRVWQSEIVQHFEQEIRHHFDAEERHLFPAARQFSDLNSLVDELVAEHTQLRDYFSRALASTLNTLELRAFAEILSSHIRKEERQLFEGM